MQLTNNSTFYYGWQITQFNRFLDFNDGTLRTATLDIGSYTSSGLATMIKKKMDALSTLDFTISFNRLTRKFTISATGSFSLPILSGTSSSLSVMPLLGFELSDLTGFSTYTGELESGFSYTTQFPIQSYKDTSINRKAIDGVINESTSGKIEVIKFGNNRFMEGEMLFITSVIQAAGSIIRSNPNGLAEYTQLIEWLTEKYPIEFMVSELNVDSFQEFILESSETDSKGLNYEIIELYDRGLADYYRSGKLTFRLLE
jgi:hypothetical protein